MLTERVKKTIFAVGFCMISIGMGFTIYWMLFRAKVTPPPAGQTPGYEGQLPQAGAGGARQGSAPGTAGELPPSSGAQPTGIPSVGGGVTLGAKTKLLRDSVTQAVTPATDGNGARFYNPDDGRFYRVTADGTITALGDKQFFNVDTVSWAHTRDEAILKFPDGSSIFYDFNDKRQVVLPKHWEDFGFAPSDDKVAAKSIGNDPDNRFLIVTNPDGNEARAIETLGENQDKAHIAWSPSGHIVGYATTGDPQSGNQQQILFIGQNRENFKSITAPGQGFVPNWSPTGKQILFSVYDPTTDNKPLLYVASGEPTTMGARRKSLALNTWADKCTWAGESELYCAVPQDMPSNAGVLRSQFATLSDDVYRIDLALGSAVKITTPDQNHPVRQPIVNKEKTKFIFSDAATGKLYSYDLH
ncbi:MAG: hypothetical protein AAB879_03095 [Patescibacteria group bacterium]